MTFSDQTFSGLAATSEAAEAARIEPDDDSWLFQEAAKFPRL